MTTLERKQELAKRLVEQLALTSAIATFLHQIASQMDERFVAEMQEILLPRLDELTALVATIWVEHFSEEELVELIEFYSTPLGLKLIQRQPEIAQSAMREGLKWGEKLALGIATDEVLLN